MDIDALVTHLADARYDAAIRRGADGTTVEMVNQSEPGRQHWVDIDADDFMDIVSGETLSAAQEGRIQNYLAGKTMVATSRAPVRQWLNANLSTTAITQLTALARVQSNYAMRAGAERVSLHDVTRAVQRMPKSHYSVHLATSQAEAEAWQARALVIAGGDPEHEVLQATHGNILDKDGNVVLASNEQLKRGV